MAFRKILGLALALILAPAAAFAQSTATPVVTGYLTTSGCSYGQTTCFVQFGSAGGPSSPFSAILPSVSLTATSPTSNVALTAGGTTVAVYNSGATTAYVNLGNNSVTASATSIPVPAGTTVGLAIGTATYIAGYAASGSDTLIITSGTGTVAGYGGGSTGGGSTSPIWVSVPTDQLGVSTASAVGLTPPATSTMCVVTATVAGVNWRADGTNPVTGASGGQPQGLGQVTQFFGATLLGTVKYINQTAASGALLNISCFKPG